MIPVSQWWQAVSGTEAAIYLTFLFTVGCVLYTCYRILRWMP